MGEPKAARIGSIVVGVALVFGLWLALGSGSGVFFFAAAPVGFGAGWFGGRAGAALVAACAALYVLGAELQQVPEFGVALTLRVLYLAAVAALATALRERVLGLEHSAEELEAIRAALAPSELPELPGVDAAAAFVASELGVSGDFYLLTNGPDGSTVAIAGDVVGHGPKAARLATFIRARFAAFAASTSDPAELLMLANAALTDRPGRQRELVSAICLRVRPEDPDIAWAVAGHPPPMWLPRLEPLAVDTSTFLLGADSSLELENIGTAIDGNDGIVVYTDGATDVRRAGEPLGLDGLARFLEPLAGFSARAIANEVERKILDWADRPIKDDLCVLVLKPDGPLSDLPAI